MLCITCTPSKRYLGCMQKMCRSSEVDAVQSEAVVSPYLIPTWNICLALALAPSRWPRPLVITAVPYIPVDPNILVSAISFEV